ncbi:hypothetical protein BKA62DRAFT_686447 [Auriculariales sp. MPI-PUGE-AT-0066]|nr:hypothetical protein BKA62DRAFT_686447 [Auriculariales sp. MPI-PUGE-AT-0066]
MSAPADTQRATFVQTDNGLLLREIGILRAQVETLRERNRILEQLLEHATTPATPTTPTNDSGTRRGSVGQHGVVRTLSLKRPAERAPAPSTLIIQPADHDDLPDIDSLPPSDFLHEALILRIPLISTASVPDVAESLSAPDVGLVAPSKCRTPAAVASFLSSLTRTQHPPYKNFHSAFKHAFDVLREQLPGCPADWRAALDAALPPLPDSTTSVAPSITPGSPTTTMRSGNFDVFSAHQLSPVSRATPEQLQLAWSVLLALSVAALGDQATTPLIKLPWSIKAQVVSLIPASLHRQTVLDFKVHTMEEIVRDYWSAKRTILSMKHGWPSE